VLPRKKIVAAVSAAVAVAGLAVGLFVALRRRPDRPGLREAGVSVPQALSGGRRTQIQHTGGSQVLRPAGPGTFGSYVCPLGWQCCYWDEFEQLEN
jgi:hypothetical protein